MKTPSSVLLQNFLPQRDCSELLETFIHPLLTSDIDSPQGIPHVTHAPLNNAPVSNLLRPSPPQLYYGIQLKRRGHQSLRTTYGTGSGSYTQGGDVRRVQTRIMPEALRTLCSRMEQLLDLPHDLNHATIIIYFGTNAPGHQGKPSKINFHSDVSYKTDGTCDPKNSQLPGSTVVVVSLFENRRLMMKEFQRKNKKWMGLPNSHPFVLSHRDVFCLVNADEYPDKNNNMSHFRHEVRMISGGISIGIALRNVQSTSLFSCLSNTLILTASDHSKLRKKIRYRHRKGFLTKAKHHDNAFQDSQHIISPMQEFLRSYVSSNQSVT